MPVNESSAIWACVDTQVTLDGSNPGRYTATIPEWWNVMFLEGWITHHAKDVAHAAPPLSSSSWDGPR
jgi:hypothetical protein